ncbi:zinc finger BED domain-containing protein RICESLEEPER 3-like [Durio zibethinus]|uniref:Zinc finger BED domain-containing protein RICESLEEPER 3-like n=1 Tax=Durio zibethinus TaxID=66656 RepID=A0A6P5WF31_DURZI|nr:zinc finger BED domain-containing protein RICESLEEPER 3-like [Durio zibethinus]
MSSTTPNISSIPVQPTINSFTSRIMSDDGNDSMNEALDATNGNTDKTPVIDANDRECDNADPEECEENGKFDMVKMRETAAHWILMHEHPFSIIEEEGFNIMQKCGMPEWEKQLQLPDRKFILDCKTHWNLAFEMLSIAIKFKEVFPRLKERESHYECCLSHEDWENVEKVCEILEVFNSATKIISGSDYPTSNLFLNEVYHVKMLLDKRMNDENEFVQAMVRKMKSKFDKYWGECNLLMSIAAILDPRCKMRVIEFCFPRINEHSVETQVHDNGISGMNIEASSSGWFEFANYVKSVETAQPQQSDLDVYLAEGYFICEGDSTKFHALEWWKASTLKYRILSKMARDILAIPITTVASKATFSAGGRVIDTYRASLSPDTVQALLCERDWCRNLYGVKKKNKKEKKSIEIALKIP